MSPGAAPRPASSFVGRTREMRLVTARLARYRVVTLTGPGGVGKTRLALAVARQSERRFPGGTWVAELAGVTEPGQVRARVADAVLGISGSTGTGTAEIAERIAGRAGLLVLDNCEHVVDSASALAAELVSQIGSLRILATSREALRIAAEATFPVPPLTPDESLLLFIERAKAREPGFVALEDTRDAVREVCDRLDGLPLAIELAAARITALSPAQLIPLLADRFALLDAGPRDAPGRQRTLRATIDWSFDLLEPAERELFSRLAVFRGGFDLAAAGAVAGGAALRTVTALVEKSMVQARSSSAPNPRYRMLDTLREYGLEQLEAGGRVDEARRAHLEHFVRRAEATFVEGLVTGQAEQLGELEPDLDNLRAALEWSVTSSPELGVRLVGAARDLWFMRAQADGLQLSEALLSRYLEPTSHRARALVTAGQLANTLQRTEEARTFLEEACRLSAALGNPSRLAWATWTVGVAGFLGEDPAGAERALRASLEMFTSLGDRTGVGRATASIGTVQFLQGDLRGARATLARALDAAEQAADGFGRGLCHLYLGLAASRADDRTGGVDHLRQAVTLLAELGDNTLLTLALAGLALNFGRADLPRALRVASAATTIRGWIGGGFAPFMTQAVAALRAEARTGLGAGSAEAEWEAGRAMTLPGAIALALGEAAPKPRPRDPLALSRREMEVARLIAEGMGNGAIAETLSLSPRTVENHVFHILSKLGLDNRTQVAAWVLASR